MYNYSIKNWLLSLPKNIIGKQLHGFNVKLVQIQTYLHLFLYARVYPYVCRALRNFIKDQLPDVKIGNKEFFVSFVDVPTRLKVRELSTDKVGTLIRISGQVRRRITELN